MQDHFLFDDSDPKQRGHGCDSLSSKDKRLKFKWQWIHRNRLSGVGKSDKRRLPCQCSEAVLKNGWLLEATFWHCDYEAEIQYYGNMVLSYHIRYDEKIKGEPPLFTRLDAQLKAEQLFEELGLDILDQVEIAAPNPAPLSYKAYKQSTQRLQGAKAK